jgi:hypothetical protein
VVAVIPTVNGLPVAISKLTVYPEGPQNLISAEYVKNPTEPVATVIAAPYLVLVPKK